MLQPPRKPAEASVLARFHLRAMRSGVQGYFGCLRSQRVTDFGRQDDQHTKWYPGGKH
jgi:hypothetical protein